MFISVFRRRISFYAGPGPQKCPYGSGSRWQIHNFFADPDPRGVNIQEEKLHQQILNKIFQVTLTNL